MMGNIFVGGEAQRKGTNCRGERKRPAAQSREKKKKKVYSSVFG
jgi:hypothetical protein